MPTITTSDGTEIVQGGAPARTEPRGMNTTDPISPTASAPPTLGDMLADIVPVLETVFVAGPPVVLVWAGTVLLALMLAGPFALLVTLIVVLVTAAALVTLAGTILVTPYLLVRHLRAHRVRHTTSYTKPPLVTVESQRATT
jgi:hypothetical protein